MEKFKKPATLNMEDFIISTLREEGIDIKSAKKRRGGFFSSFWSRTKEIFKDWISFREKLLRLNEFILLFSICLHTIIGFSFALSDGLTFSNPELHYLIQTTNDAGIPAGLFFLVWIVSAVFFVVGIGESNSNQEIKPSIVLALIPMNTFMWFMVFQVFMPITIAIVTAIFTFVFLPIIVSLFLSKRERTKEDNKAEEDNSVFSLLGEYLESKKVEGLTELESYVAEKEKEKGLVLAKKQEQEKLLNDPYAAPEAKKFLKEKIKRNEDILGKYDGDIAKVNNLRKEIEKGIKHLASNLSPRLEWLFRFAHTMSNQEDLEFQAEKSFEETTLMVEHYSKKFSNLFKVLENKLNQLTEIKKLTSFDDIVDYSSIEEAVSESEAA